MTLMRLKCACMLILLWAALPSTAFSGIPPAGFQESVVLSGLPQVNGFDWDPNGDLWIIQKIGTLQVLRSGAALPTMVHQFTVDTLDERGLLGLAIDPDFLTNGYL